MLNWRLSTWAAAAAIAGCASAPLDWPTPSNDVVNSNAGDYKAFVQVWMGALPRKNWGTTFPLMPSDARLLALRSVTGQDRQLRGLADTFKRWCANSHGAAQTREEDMVSPGSVMLVCEAQPTAEKIAALRVYLDPDATREGRLEHLVQHWYPPDIDRYILSMRERSARSTAARAKAHADRTALVERDRLAEQLALAERKARDLLLLEQLATAARLRPAPPCQRFERESNAVRVRFTGTVHRADLARYVSDLIVSFDECTHAKAGAPAALADVYRFNLQSFQLFADVWDADLLACDLKGNCRANGRPASHFDQRDMARLQARYAAIKLSAPERVEEILERVQRFVLDR